MGYIVVCEEILGRLQLLCHCPFNIQGWHGGVKGSQAVAGSGRQWQAVAGSGLSASPLCPSILVPAWSGLHIYSLYTLSKISPEYSVICIWIH